MSIPSHTEIFRDDESCTYVVTISFTAINCYKVIGTLPDKQRRGLPQCGNPLCAEAACIQL